MARTKGKKEKITFYAPPQISFIIEKIISTGVESSLSEAICRSISEYWILLQEQQGVNESDQRFEKMQQEINNLQATIDVMTDRLALLEQKYSRMNLAVAEKGSEYCRTSKKRASDNKAEKPDTRS